MPGRRDHLHRLVAPPPALGAPHARAGRTQVREDLGVGAAGVLQCVGQHGEAGRLQAAAWLIPPVVGRLGEPHHGAPVPGQPGRVDGRRREVGAAEHVTEQPGLGGPLLLGNRFGFSPGGIKRGGPRRERPGDRFRPGGVTGRRHGRRVRPADGVGGVVTPDVQPEHVVPGAAVVGGQSGGEAGHQSAAPGVHHVGGLGVGCREFLVGRRPVREPLRRFHRPPAPLVEQSVPDAAAARGREQPGLPLGQLAAATQEGEHLLRVGRGQPVALRHGLTSTVPD
jgi:hypothetical protein